MYQMRQKGDKTIEEVILRWGRRGDQVIKKRPVFWDRPLDRWGWAIYYLPFSSCWPKANCSMSVSVSR